LIPVIQYEKQALLSSACFSLWISIVGGCEQHPAWTNHKKIIRRATSPHKPGRNDHLDWPACHIDGNK
jgi:hypothetical protein